MNPVRIRLGFLLRLRSAQLREAIRALLATPAAQQLSERLRNELLAILHEEAADRLRDLLRRLYTPNNNNPRS